MKPRFQPDDAPPGKPASDSTLVDPEAYDASEQRFAASLEDRPAKSKFVIAEPPDSATDEIPVPTVSANGLEVSEEPAAVPVSSSATKTESSGEDPDAWRQELQDKINHYRARKRPRPPRYPSLQLKFEAPESGWTSGSVAVQPQASAAFGQDSPAQNLNSHRVESTEPAPPMNPDPSEGTAKILEFPRPLILQDDPNSLAGPVLDRPRILEVPEVLPPPPALGGILIEPTEEERAKQERLGFDVPLQAASMARRIAASAIDLLLVSGAFVLFGYIFRRITSHLPPQRETMLASAALLATFWAGYQYLLLVYTASTPGLKLAKLKLTRFDGQPVPRRVRAWRVLTSILSGVSLGLGYAWCFFDEDQLCWHDRITRTYMALSGPNSSPDTES